MVRLGAPLFASLFFTIAIVAGCTTTTQLAPDDAGSADARANCAPLERFENGRCVCALECGGSCVDRLSDGNNCGGCGTTCAADEACFWGTCTDCQEVPGSLVCDGTCVNPKNDSRNCGACGVSCGDGPCSDGLCCDYGEKGCGGRCVDVRTRDDCGGCGVTCAADEACDGLLGKCVESDCAPDQIVCSGECKDGATDVTSCGGCGTVCVAPPGAVSICVKGSCTARCDDPNTRFCPSKNTCEAESKTSCGPACAACPSPSSGAGVASCESGACELDCAPGLEASGGACVTATSGGGPQTGAPWPLPRHDAMRTGRGTGPSLFAPKIAWTAPLGLGYGGATSIDASGALVFMMDSFAEPSRIVSTSATGAKTWEIGLPLLDASSPFLVAEDGTLYATQHTFSSSASALYARRRDGTKKWRRTFAGAMTEPALGATGTVYVGEGAAVRAYGANGASLWSVALGASTAVVHAPAVAPNGSLRVTTATASAGALTSISAAGVVSWSHPLAASPNASPAIAPDGTSYVVSQTGVVYAIRADGVELWKVDFQTAFVTAPMLAPDGAIVVRTFTLANPTADKITALHAGGTTKWVYPAPAGVSFGAPVLAGDGTVYVFATSTAGHRMIALDPAGTLRWELAVPGRVHHASIAANGALLLQANVGGTATLVAITD